ncbi:MAG: SdrD B-like domain-containing protein, partial [Bacteroidota bacterium]
MKLNLPQALHSSWMMLLSLPFIFSTALPSSFENTGSVTAYVWDDQNGDGIQNDNEPALQNIKVNLLNASNNVIDDAITDMNGEAVFLNVVAGNYKIEVLRPTGHKFTLRDVNGAPESKDSDVSVSNGRSNTFSLTGGQSLDNQDAGLWTPGQVTTYVWDDLNGDGRQNDNEPGIEGVEVRLLNANNNAIAFPAGDSNAGDDVVATTGSNG